MVRFYDSEQALYRLDQLEKYTDIKFFAKGTSCTQYTLKSIMSNIKISSKNTDRRIPEISYIK